MTPLRKLLAGVLVAISAAGANAQGEAWPVLPKQGFISGRTATRSDIAAGNAVFVPEIGGVSAGRPLAIMIPQYAYYNEAGKRTPAIIVQAEEVQGMKMLGARLANGKQAVGLLENFELLGKTPPKK
jgi:hypothetical protein